MGKPWAIANRPDYGRPDGASGALRESTMNNGACNLSVDFETSKYRVTPIVTLR
jgi:hypothetical protein